MSSNRDISHQFRLYAELLLVHDQDERLADLLSGAAYRLQKMEQDVSTLSETSLKIFFKAPIVKLIGEMNTTGNMQALDNLIELTPAGLFDLMRIKGLGGKKLSVIWHTAKIDSVGQLLEACRKGRISRIPGFGKKTEQNIIAAIEAANNTLSQFHYADVADAASKLVESLQQSLKTDLVSLCGDIRRQTTTVEKIELIAAVPPKSLYRQEIKKLLHIAKSEKDTTTAHTLDEIPVTIYHTTEAGFGKLLFQRTGVAAHVEKVQKRAKGSRATTEEGIYKAAAMPFIVPEMRENLAEWAYARKPAPLIRTEDIKGVVHNHTTWSDGVDTLEDFVRACIRRGFDYTVISDHSQNAHYAGGLKPDKVAEQFEAIDRLQTKVHPFRIFKSIECDIKISGELDYDKSLLAQFDLVIISIHQQLKMSIEKATDRLIKAIENPYTTILGHMTGRQLLIRPGYPLDFKKVIDACAANGVVIEVNANPYRLDMDWSHIPYALEKGVMISINPDAHSISEIDNIRWGVSAARKGGLTRERTWNAHDLAFIEQWLQR